MPRGAAPGERRGGREKGSKNKSTIEKELLAAEIASRTAMHAHETGDKLAKDALNEAMKLAGGMAAHYQPAPPQMPPNPTANLAEFKYWMERFTIIAKWLAPYQSPMLKSIEVYQAPPPPPRVPGDDAKVIDINDPKIVQRQYLALVKSSKKALG